MNVICVTIIIYYTVRFSFYIKGQGISDKLGNKFEWVGLNIIYNTRYLKFYN